jgi:hypothetical protein
MAKVRRKHAKRIQAGSWSMKKVMRTLNTSVVQLAGLVMLWRVGLTLISYFAITRLPFEPTFPYARELLFPLGSKLLSVWAHFDGVHYLTIIFNGYHAAALIQAFFPLYPLVIKILSGLSINILFLCIDFSTLSFFVSLILLVKLAKKISPNASQIKIVLLLLLFPTSFFFTSFYSEGLFLMLILASFLALEKKAFALAGLLGALSSATRLTGIFLVPAFVYVWWKDFHHLGLKMITHPKSLTRLFWSLIPALGLGAYMLYLAQNFSDPLLFVHVQDKFGALRETDRIILIYQVFFRYVKMLFTVYPLSLTYVTVLFEFGAGLLGLMGTILVYKFLPRQYFFYTLFSYITPTLTGTFSSMPRYLLTMFPIFMVFALKLPRKVYVPWLIASAILLAVATVIFTTGKWVA